MPVAVWPCIAGSKSVAGIFDKSTAMLVGDLTDRRNIRRVPAHMDHENSLQLRAVCARNGFLEIIRRHQAGLGIHIAEYDLGPAKARCIGCRDEGNCRDDHLVARFQAHGNRSQVQGCGTIGAGHCERRTGISAQLLFESLDFRPGCQKVTPERLGDGIDVVVINELPAIR